MPFQFSIISIIYTFESDHQEEEEEEEDTTQDSLPSSFLPVRRQLIFDPVVYLSSYCV